MRDLDETYHQLRRIMQEATPNFPIATDEAGEFSVNTPQIDPKTGKPAWFGTVAIKKSYVAYHLFPLYTHPAIGDGISAALQKRRQGKSCFNFAKPDDALFAELAQLTTQAALTVWPQ